MDQICILFEIKVTVKYHSYSLESNLPRDRRAGFDCMCSCVRVCVYTVSVIRPGECWEVASEVMELERLRLAVMLSWLWPGGG